MPQYLLNRGNFRGPWAGLPVAWTANDEFDRATFRNDVVRCCRAGIPGVYTGGTTGEFYAVEFEEFQQITETVVEAAHECGTPAMIGVTATCTRSAVRRAQFAAAAGADAIQVALPFWMTVPDSQIVPFFRDVAAAAPELAFSVYETTRAKRVLTIAEHAAIREAVPQYVMVKSNAGTVGCSVEGCRALHEFVNVFVGEHLWPELGPAGAAGCCSACVYWNPRVILGAWESVEQQDWESLAQVGRKLQTQSKFLHETFGSREFTDTAFDRLGSRATGFLQTSLSCRAPYPGVQPEDVELLRKWYRDNFPEMLDLPPAG